MPIDQALLDNSSSHLKLIEEASASIKAKLGTVPETLVVAGSGLGKFAERVDNATEAGYEEFAHFPQSTVVGHAGKLVWGTVKGKPCVVMAGRKHVYEGVDIRETTIPLRALIHAGVKNVILSNAAGGLNKNFKPGDLMLIDDHVNMQFKNPLIGANIDSMGPRFPDMSDPYTAELRAIAREAAVELKIKLHEGTYVALTGPTYETQAEVGMFKMMADAVGMSTAPECIVANHAGAKVLGISAITNSHVLTAGVKTTHDEVIEIGKQLGETFCLLVERIIEKL